MTTKLEKALKREISIKGEPFVLTITPEGFKLVAKGRRKGLEATWEALVSGEAALAAALRASLSPSVDLTPATKTRAEKPKPARRR